MPRAALFVVAALLAAPGCARLSIPDAAVAALEDGTVDAHHVVFVVEGMLKDLGSDWEEELARGLTADGRLPITVRYWTDPTGVWFNWGCRAPGRLLAEAADALVDLHTASGSPRPLILDAVGFSAGCEALLFAFEHVGRARFRRVVFVNSSSLFLSTEAARRIDEGRVGDLVNYWSPVDGTTILAPLGAGQFGLRTGSERVTNERTFIPHSARFLGDAEFVRFRASLGGAIAPGRPDAFTAEIEALGAGRDGDGELDFPRHDREARDVRRPVPSLP